jgi:hypothetical protein
MPDKPVSDDAVPPPSDAMRELGQLISSGHFVVLDNTRDALVCVHAHDDGSVDTLGIVHEDDAGLERTDPEGFAVWRLEHATLAEVLKALSALPDPNQPGAPTVRIPQSRRPIDSDM